MSKSKDTEKYEGEVEEVGYGKPPIHTRFKKGQSGNPKGRPKKSLSINKMLGELFLKKETIMVNGKAVEMPVIKAALMKQREKILQGDTAGLKAIWPQLMEIVKKNEPQKPGSVFFINDIYDEDVSDEEWLEEGRKNTVGYQQEQKRLLKEQSNKEIDNENT